MFGRWVTLIGFTPTLMEVKVTAKLYMLMQSQTAGIFKRLNDVIFTDGNNLNHWFFFWDRWNAVEKRS